MGHHNIRKFGQTAKGVQRYQCKTCKKTFAERKGPSFTAAIMHHKPSWTAWPGFRTALAGARFIAICGVKEETVCAWLQQAAQHVEEIEAVMLANYPVSRAQLDALWTYVGHKGEKGGTLRKRHEVASGEARPLR